MQNKIDLYGNEPLFEKNKYVPDFQIVGPIAFRPSEFPKKKYPKGNISAVTRRSGIHSFLGKWIKKFF
jgi:hypothetical protein